MARHSDRKQDVESCFVSAPIGADLAPLRDELAKRGIEMAASAELQIGASVLDSIRHAVRSADLVIAVLQEGATGSVLLEVGLAVGVGRPVLVIADSGADIPSHLQAFPVVWGGLSAIGAVQFQLDQLLSSKPRTSRRKPESRSTAALGSRVEGYLARLPLGEEKADTLALESLVVDLFRDAGAQTVTRSELTGSNLQRPDFAVWSDSLTGVTGNPLVAELKLDLGLGSAETARLRLADYVGAVGASWGLLLYVRGPEDLTDVAPILQIRLDRFIRDLRDRPLEEVLRHRRNRAVHRRED